MTVYFIGAGPGAPDLITVRGLRLIERCPVCLYAGSLVPAEIVAAAPDGRPRPRHRADASRRDHRRDGSGARARRGCRPRPFRRSLALRRHRRADAPARRARHPLRDRAGRAAFAGAAARLGAELTLPEITQTVILTRTSGKASADARAASASKCSARRRATLAIHLSIRNLAYVETALTPHYGADCPVVDRLSRHLAGRGDHPHHARRHARPRPRGKDHPHGADLRRAGASARRSFRDSRLYDPGFAHVLRNRGKKTSRQVDAGGEVVNRSRWLPRPIVTLGASGRVGRSIMTTVTPSAAAASSLARVWSPPEFLVTRWVMPSVAHQRHLALERVGRPGEQQIAHCPAAASAAGRSGGRGNRLLGHSARTARSFWPVVTSANLRAGTARKALAMSAKWFQSRRSAAGPGRAFEPQQRECRRLAAASTASVEIVPA